MTAQFNLESVVIEDTQYIRADLCQQRATGNRAVVVVDRGWIFAGNVQRTEAEITLSQVVHVFKWSSIGFDGMIANPKSNNVDLRKMNQEVKIPIASVIFAIPVDDDWGI